MKTLQANENMWKAFAGAAPAEGYSAPLFAELTIDGRDAVMICDSAQLPELPAEAMVSILTFDDDFNNELSFTRRFLNGQQAEKFGNALLRSSSLGKEFAATTSNTLLKSGFEKDAFA